MKLTPQQLRLMEILADHPKKSLTAQEVLDIVGDEYVWAGREGVHQTASSLSRRGLAIRRNPTAIPQRGVSYEISIAGLTTLQKQKQPRSGVRRGEAPT